jgi:hypothetical protein
MAKQHNRTARFILMCCSSAEQGSDIFGAFFVRTGKTIQPELREVTSK